MSVFILEHIYKSFENGKNQIPVLKDINLSLPNSGFVSIVGKSGSGKSTLLNILSGIEKPSKGSIYFNGKNLSKFSDKSFSKYHLSGVSLVFQHYNLFDNLNAIDNAVLPLLMKGYSKSKAYEIAKSYFKKFGLENIQNNKSNLLSGGEKQRVAIIRSLVVNPSAILCDEPTGALDERNSYEIMNILKDISNSTLVIMVSHNLKLVEEFSDEIYVLKEGQISQKKICKKREFSIKKANDKYKYSSKWTGKIIKTIQKTSVMKILFCFLASIISFTSIILSIGFINGSSSSQEDAINKNFSRNFATISKIENFEITNSPVTYQKLFKPEPELIDEVLNDFKTIEIKDNLSFFLSDYSSCTLNKHLIRNFQMIPVLKEFDDKDMLMEGNLDINSFNEVIVNKEFIKTFSDFDIENAELIISSNAETRYMTGNDEEPFINDNFIYSMKFKIIGVVNEFSFLNTPKIYYSYEFAKNYLSSEKMINLSNYLQKSVSFYDYLKNCKNDDYVCSYSYYLFVDDSELPQFYNRIRELKNDPTIEITSTAYEIKETYSLFISSFSDALILFLSIAFIGINLIIGMISLSTFLEHKKETAILTSIGSKNKNICNIFLSINYKVIIYSILLSLIISYFLQSKLNDLLMKKFLLKDLIKVPFANFFGVKYGFVFLLIIFSLTIVTLVTLVPMVIYRNKSLVDELRDE